MLQAATRPNALNGRLLIFLRSAIPLHPSPLLTADGSSKKKIGSSLSLVPGTQITEIRWAPRILKQGSRAA